MKTMYDFGLSKIYEVVINTNPAYGFLLETNSPIQNKMVIAHVLGHVDFFKNNTYFSKTNRRMVESVSTHAQRMMEYEFKYGRKTVERFLDAVLAIEEHIDPVFLYQTRDSGPPKSDAAPSKDRKMVVTTICGCSTKSNMRRTRKRLVVTVVTTIRCDAIGCPRKICSTTSCATRLRSQPGSAT
jgi:spore cortex formation protein SpoVR/YcgB (stage V sporulation)